MTIERLNERIQGLVDRFNRDHKEITAKIQTDGVNITVSYVTKPQMKAEWIKWMMQRYREDSHAYVLTIDYYGEVVVVKTSNHGIGTAVCGHDDNFDEETGIAIAYARSIGEEVPDFM